MTRFHALAVFGSALVVAGCGVIAHSGGGTDLTRTEGNESGPGRGEWRAQEGMFEPYRHGAIFAVLFTVKNTSSEPLTLISAGDPETGHRLLRRIGVHFALVQQACDRCTPMPGLSPPFGAVEPTPLTVPPDREAQVQFNFVMGECQFFSPREQQTYNRSTTVHYRIGDVETTITLDLTGDQVTINAPDPSECPTA